MTPTEAALRELTKALSLCPGFKGVASKHVWEALNDAERALAAPLHGKDVGEDAEQWRREHQDALEKNWERLVEIARSERDALQAEAIAWRKVAQYYLGDFALTRTPEECRTEAFKRDTAEASIQELILTAGETLGITVASPQDLITHVELLREERDALQAELAETSRHSEQNLTLWRKEKDAHFDTRRERDLRQARLTMAEGLLRGWVKTAREQGLGSVDTQAFLKEGAK